MNDTTPHSHGGPEPTRPGPSGAAVHPMVQAVADVKATLEAGLIDPAALGLAPLSTAINVLPPEAA